MAPTSQAHDRAHRILLLQRVLNMRDAASPLTLVLDSLEQPARPLISEMMTRAKMAKTTILFVSFSTLLKPRNVDHFIKAAGRDLGHVRSQLLAHYPAPNAAAGQRAVVIIDSFNNLVSAANEPLVGFLSSLARPTVSLVCVHHMDVPVIGPATANEYEPQPLTVVTHLATAVLRLSKLGQELERQKARNRALEEPEWGLGEGREGAVIGLAGAWSDEEKQGLVIEMELRRRSGRTVSERYILAPGRGQREPGRRQTRTARTLSLLADHRLWAAPEPEQAGTGPESSFDLGLTEKQRRDRDQVVLPYFDAQTEVGGGQGGRILYEMGREDDFDEEEDEI